MSALALLTLLYSFIIMIGGIIGLVKAGSIASLTMSLAFGISLFYLGIKLFKGTQSLIYLTMGLIAFLLLFFIYRYTISFRFMPSGLMSMISAIVLFIFLLFLTGKRD